MELLSAPFVTEAVETADAMFRHGWNEASGGNISLLLTPEEAAPFAGAPVLRRFAGQTAVPALEGRLVLISATGSRFRRAKAAPGEGFGLLRIEKDAAALLWGFENGGRPTSELSSHLLGHAARLETDPAQRVMLHCHPENIIAMSCLHPADPAAWSRSLWSMFTECLVVFPEGVGALPWQLFGTDDLGRATAGMLRRHRALVWTMHGLCAVGTSGEDALGLAETIDKAAAVWLATRGADRQNAITPQQLAATAEALGLPYRREYLFP